MAVYQIPAQSRTLRPVLIVVAAIRFTIVWKLRSGLPRQFWLMKENSRCSILNYCRTKVPLGVVEAVNGNIKSLIPRGRGYKNLRYLLLKAQRMAVTRTEFVVVRKAA